MPCDFRGPSLRLHYLAGALFTILLSVGAVSLIHLTLPYSSPGEVFWISFIAGVLLCGLGTCLTLLTDRRHQDRERT